MGSLKGLKGRFNSLCSQLRTRKTMHFWLNKAKTLMFKSKTRNLKGHWL